MMRAVRFFSGSASACWMRCSLSESSELVASSRMRIDGSFSSARAMRDALALAAGKLHAALADDRRVAFGKFFDEGVAGRQFRGRDYFLEGRRQAGRAMFSSIEPPKSRTSCGTMAIFARRSRRVRSPMGLSSTRTRPESTS